MTTAIATPMFSVKVSAGLDQNGQLTFTTEGDPETITADALQLLAFMLTQSATNTKFAQIAEQSAMQAFGKLMFAAQSQAAPPQIVPVTATPRGITGKPFRFEDNR